MNEGRADVQGSSRLESASSWGMIVIVGLAMFVFIGILASRPRVTARGWLLGHTSAVSGGARDS